MNYMSCQKKAFENQLFYREESGYSLSFFLSMFDDCIFIILKMLPSVFHLLEINSVFTFLTEK